MAQTSESSSVSIPDRSSQTKMLIPTARPPKSKTEPYYAIHPNWSDLTPIPQLDLDEPSTYTSGSKPLSPDTAQKLASAGPALATIAYTPRYVEAMSYLRAMMAKEEYSERALILTEDIISMNPAHYTVWIYRFRVLKELWGPFTTTNEAKQTVIKKEARQGFDHELGWLEKISEKNLKNYQIWHHRQSLFQLLPLSLPPSSSASWVKSLLDVEPGFLRGILALDAKNYHVWSYRQWLCAHFSDHFLVDNRKEIEAMDMMIQEDVMNNSAWNHRYFICFGFKRNVEEQEQMAALDSSGPGSGQTAHNADSTSGSDIIDLDVVDQELEYVKDKIRLAPQNGSTWNYLKGILKYAGVPVTDMKEFCSEFVGDEFRFDILNGEDGGEKGVQSSQAVEMCVEIFALEAEAGASEEAKEKVRSGLDMLSEKWDPIRRRYWAWRLARYEQNWKE